MDHCRAFYVQCDARLEPRCFVISSCNSRHDPRGGSGPRQNGAGPSQSNAPLGAPHLKLYDAAPSRRSPPASACSSTRSRSTSARRAAGRRRQRRVQAHQPDRQGSRAGARRRQRAAESLVIGEYLEDRFPSRRCARPLRRPARACGSSRTLPTPTSSRRSTRCSRKSPTRRARPEADRREDAELATRYDQLTGFPRAGGPYAMGNALTLADCVAVPALLLRDQAAPDARRQGPDRLAPALATWWEAVQKHPAVAKVNAELGKALAEQMR